MRPNVQKARTRTPVTRPAPSAGGDHVEPECPEGKDSDDGGKVNPKALAAALRGVAEAFKQEAQKETDLAEQSGVDLRKKRRQESELKGGALLQRRAVIRRRSEELGMRLQACRERAVLRSAIDTDATVDATPCGTQL